MEYKRLDKGTNGSGNVDSVVAVSTTPLPKARCFTCGIESDAGPHLPFLKKDEEGKYKYYCGCRGWD